MTNVGGQIAVPLIVARGEGILDDERLATPSAPPLLSDDDDEPAPGESSDNTDEAVPETAHG
ncbi:hypothetical protein FHX42_004274 [Saccharopolyspora lacisalsi]|uniref:Uncharacterized protein n=1 Tax=Halosaccharopolyspora lacisalsi TaxID=1000566 RepID=A0A839E4Y5_9PSEU|nr:hypothetical protein [Halosaccharopolyspora lacisalsi]